jgi:hypothetical protein
MPAIGGLPGAAKVSASGRLSLMGDFAALSLALKFAFFPETGDLVCRDLVRDFLLTQGRPSI